MSSLIKEVDARTGLAGTNQMELLLFHVGTSEVFGINVFKVREVMKFPVLTRLPEADPRVEGMANIRGTTVPVIGLTKIIVGLTDPERREPSEGKLIVTEYNGSLQAFHVAGVDRILRLSWTQIKSPPPLVRNNTKGAVTAVAMLDDGRMVSGSLIVITLPFPTWESISTLPLIRRMLVRTTSMPTPRPDTSVTFSAVLNPGKKTILSTSRGSMLASSASLAMPRDRAFALIRSTCRPFPSS